MVEVENIKTARTRIACVNEVLNRGVVSQTTLVVTTRTYLWEAFMWLGEQLGTMKQPNPYPASYDSKSAVIEKTADDFDAPVVETLIAEIKDLDDTGKVKYLRAVIKEIMGEKVYLAPESAQITKSLNSLTMAKNFLGLILREIRSTFPSSVIEQWDAPPVNPAEPVKSENPRPTGGLGL